MGLTESARFRAKWWQEFGAAVRHRLSPFGKSLWLRAGTCLLPVLVAKDFMVPSLDPLPRLADGKAPG